MGNSCVRQIEDVDCVKSIEYNSDSELYCISISHSPPTLDGGSTRNAKIMESPLSITGKYFCLQKIVTGQKLCNC